MSKIKEVILKTKKTFFSPEFFKFICIGVLNTFNSAIFSSIFSNFLNANVSFVIGYIVSLSISYLLNSFVTFKEALDWKKYYKFCLSYVPNFIIQNIVVFIIYNVLGWHQYLAYGIAAIIGVPVTFLLMKFFAFNNKK